MNVVPDSIDFGTTFEQALPRSPPSSAPEPLMLYPGALDRLIRDALPPHPRRSTILSALYFTLSEGFGIIMAFRRKEAGWPLECGTDIVRELTGSVKPLEEGRHLFPPSDNNVAARYKSFLGNTAPFHLANGM